ncbi:hypothetical protein [Hamadaea tsunoensis]|uniref:hypothetical protein n=1 Tax=Hamadaea tsunoensis TaxID=53368 RepID=UPI000688367B|nr:hypothetical protein [Hamadaea tsunoensis]
MQPTGAVSSRLRKIAVDLLGGDHAPAVVVDGALSALTVDPEVRLLLVGPPEAAGDALRHLPGDLRDRVEVRAARTGVAMGDPPNRAASAATSIRIAARAHASGEVDAVVSAGSSGATVTAAALELGRHAGVRAPALAAWLPTIRHDRRCLLLDVGGSIESSVATLLSHAALGVAYRDSWRTRSHPQSTVGLLSIGREPGKGDRVRRAAEKALAESDLAFTGLVEGHDVLLGDRAEIVVTDGFTGNVLLKGIEGALRMTGAAVAAPARAAALLGVRGNVVVCHGAATADDLASGVALAARLARRETEEHP